MLLVPVDPWHETVATVQRLEALGYHRVWVYDHLSWQRFRNGPWHATMPWITGLAAATDRIRFGTMVSNLNVRHPLLLAKDAMTIDHVSTGRLTIGLGAAGVGFDSTVLGQDPLTPGQRMDRLIEFSDLFDGLLRDEIRSHDGEYYTVDEARLLPGCVQRPRIPLAIAAGGRRGLHLAARVADAWVTHGANDGVRRSGPETERIVRQQIAWLEAGCDAVGRDHDEIDYVFLNGHDLERPLDSLDAFDDFVGRYAELGFGELVFHHPRPDDEIWNEPIEMVEMVAERYLA